MFQLLVYQLLSSVFNWLGTVDGYIIATILYHITVIHVTKSVRTPNSYAYCSKTIICGDFFIGQCLYYTRLNWRFQVLYIPYFVGLFRVFIAIYLQSYVLFDSTGFTSTKDAIMHQFHTCSNTIRTTIMILTNVADKPYIRNKRDVIIVPSFYDYIVFKHAHNSQLTKDKS